MADEQDKSDGVDRTLEDRLAMLGKAKVDTSRLERQLDAAIPHGRSTGLTRTWATHRFYALAATLLLVAGVALIVIFMRPAGPRIITAKELVAIHEHYRDHDNGQLITSVSTIADANVHITRQWSDAPLLPDLQDGKIAECCVFHLSDCRVACLHMKTRGGSEVTMVVGHSRDLQAADGSPLESNGQKFTFHRVGAYHILATQTADRFVALVADVPLLDLQKIASGMKL